ncbi:LuxR family transcriptional regulator [Agrobacterium larrymoorei]|uniref:helix-turn-helix transcriptional regulator n=1 Tax=Agrobacterium larrymoorei TaxID=160699 RepID=UPI00157247AB|nr:LuxR family transcriptional regulator [Agrobacterium larrymoorei]NTJ43009.1 LuxR family transcriptional regulator [Agrobacterium larrymoorei]
MATIERQSLLIEEISAADSRPRWLQALQNVAKKFGFSHATLFRVPQVWDELNSSSRIETTMPMRFLREFDQFRDVRQCPVEAKICSSLVPHCWSLNDDISMQSCPEQMQQLMRRFGIVNGVLVPVSSLSGDRYILSFDGDCPPPCQIVLNELGMVALHAFDVYDKMRRAELIVPKALTKRELEVVRWTSHGKTSAEIGQILNLSDHTINAYLNNAIKKLDCVNRTQLVAKAIRYKLIN